ncbi:winged helix-turn-helix domain-containing protein, partial [Chitinimonas sp.]|uniref:protein kinase domain-containing protein n=1 Tax=Chitinimonas sp. TaxID=1934313 RepID=UPI0035AF11C8
IMSTLYRYRFGSSTLDESTGELTVNGLAVDIQPQSLRLLLALLSQRGEIVARKELEEQVWHGRLLGENVLASAITRLRSVLGESNAGLIEAIPRIGYRIAIPVQRTAVGQGFASALQLSTGQPAPARPGFVLERMIGQTPGGEVWLGRNPKSGALRVYKYAADAGSLGGLKREATLAQLLYEQLGEREDLLRIVDWNFETAPFFLEAEYGGENLLSWSQSNEQLQRLSPDDRLQLFLQIAEPVAAAHSVAVIHKDIKPANILIEAQEHGWRIRLADFGSGRLTDEQRLGAISLTGLGAAGPKTILSDDMRGTAMYIAPEIWRDMPSTERSDLYSLGVLLYQLMIGDLRQPLLPGWERQLGDTLLIEEIRQATDGDPQHRTSSVATLIANLRQLPERHIERQQQIEAQEQALRDRRALARERANRPWLLALIGTLLIGIGFCLYAYLNLKDSEAALAEQIRNVQALNQFMSRDLIGQANPSRTGQTNITVQQAAIRAAKTIDGPASPYSPSVHLALHLAMQSNFEAMENYELAAQQGEHALAILKEMPQADPDLIDEVRVTYALSLRSLSKVKEASAQLDLVEKNLFRPGAKPSETQVRYWQARSSLAGAAFQWQRALADAQEAAAILARLPNADPALSETISNRMVFLYRALADFPKAERLARDNLRSMESRYGKAHYLSCVAAKNLADVLIEQKKVDEGLPLAEQMVDCMSKATSPGANSTGYALNVLGTAYDAAGQWAKAASVYMQAADTWEANGKTMPRGALVARLNAAKSYAMNGQAAIGEPILVKALADAKKLFGSNSAPLVLGMRFELAGLLLDQRDTRGVAELLDGLSAEQLKATNTQPAWEARLQYQRGRLALYRHDKAAAVSLLEQAVQGMQAQDPESLTLPPQRVRSYLEQARALPESASSKRQPAARQ